MADAPESRFDALVVGAGVIGLATAWRLAQAGWSVCMVDPMPERASSWFAAGMLAPVTEAVATEPHMARLNLAAAELWPAFAARLAQHSGIDPAYRQCGTLLIARDPSDSEALDRQGELLDRFGLPWEKLSSRRLRELEPLVSPRVHGGIIAESDHQVDTRALLRALRQAAERAGVQSISAEVVDLILDQGRVQGGLLADGQAIYAGAVVLAAGAWSGSIGRIPPELRPPIRPVKGQIARLRWHQGALLSRTVRAVVHGRPVYVLARPTGEVVVGATMEERGFDTTVEVGRLVDLLSDAREVIPLLEQAELVEFSAGLRPAAPDNTPVVRPGPVEGLVWATGHFRHGILLAPLSAEVVAGLLGLGKVPEAWVELGSLHEGSSARVSGKTS